MSLSGSVDPDLVDAAQEVIEEELQLAEFRVLKPFAMHWSVWMMSMWRRSSGGDPT